MPIDRPDARVLPVSQAGRVLLLQDQDPAEPGVLRWGTIGGALDAGEPPAAAAVREMFEETGILVSVEALVGPVHQDSRLFSYDRVEYHGHSTFFAVALAEDVEVSFAHLEPVEVDNVVAAGWWTPEELAATGGMIADDLPAVMRVAIDAVRHAQG